MKLTPELLSQQWDDIDYKQGGFLQINIMHPLEWHIGYQSISQRTLLLLCNADIEAIESSKSLIVSRRHRESDNRWLLTFELVNDAQQDVFAILCCDIIEYSSAAQNEHDSLALVINRYRQWTRLLESQKNGLMEEHIRKGLLGELLFLEYYMQNCDSKLYAVNGWAGAEAGDQDFMYAEGWYEMKATGISSSTVTISSLEQLDCIETGELVIMRIDRVVSNKADAISLNDVVYRIREKLLSHKDAFELFHQKLTHYGYIDIQEYSDTKYYFSKMERFTVDKSFPRILKSTIPNEIVSLSYELSLPALSKFLKG
ncbi:TPA: PD-(D/E)XK motif protein [Enterobacter kobei]|nr:PD-(D/E)XK motif protein [Enterobacter kobei]